MKKFTVPCDFGGVQAPFTIYIGSPEDSHHPLHFQADWLSKERGGSIPQEVMDSVAKLKELADKNNVSFEDLCVYALGTAQQEANEGGDDDASDSATVDDEVDDTDNNDDDTSSDDAAAEDKNAETSVDTK